MKVLNIQDIHVSPKWIDESKKHISRICEVARQEKVNAIISGGDFFDRQVVASDENNWNEILNMARDLQEVAPVYFVSGTPGHDSPGCYSSFIDIGWKEISIGKSSHVTIINEEGAATEQLLLMGIPEITPAFIINQHPELSKAEIIAKQYEIVDSLIETYYKPLATNHDGPVQFVFHGHIAGAKFRDDQKPRTSEFMYSEAMLDKIGADFIHAGHIHLPQSFKDIFGRYGGSAHITWNDLNFKPGFDIVDYLLSKKDICPPTVTRFDYGEPARKKLVIKNIEDISTLIPRDMPLNGENLWIDIECDKSFAEQFGDGKRDLEGLKSEYNIGPLSKITTNIQHVDNVRIDTEEYEKAKTLEDIYKILIPDAPESMLHKVRELETKVSADSKSEKKRNFDIEYLYLKGTKAGMENGVQEIEIDFNDFQTGANIIEGANGTGKSFTLGFIPPFSEHFPESLDLKTLFELKDSQIIRRYRDGETVIEQKIMIDPTLAAPTARYYMSIDGEAIKTCTGLKDPFDKAVDDIFGSIKMFMICAFRGQKENPKHPSLARAKEADLRKNFEELAGINYTPHKLTARDTVKEIQRSMELKLNEKNTLESVVESVEEIEKSISQKEIEILEKRKEAVRESDITKERKTSLEKIEEDQRGNKSINESIVNLKTEEKEIEKDIWNKDQALFQCKKTLGSANDTRKELVLLEDNSRKAFEIQQKLSSLQEKYSKDLTAWNLLKSSKDSELTLISEKADEIKEGISNCEKQLSSLTDSVSISDKEINLLNKPCEHCNKIPTIAADDRIKELKAKIVESEKSKDDLSADKTDLETALQALRDDYKKVKDSITEQPKEPEEIKSLKTYLEKVVVDQDRLNRKREEVKELDNVSGRMETIKLEIEKSKLRIEKINIDISSLEKKLKEVDFGMISTLKQKISDSELKLNQISTSIGTLSAEIKALYVRREKANETLVKIETIDSELSTSQEDCSEWSRIEEAFSPKGVPALELSMVAPIIARDTNRLLSVYGSRFKVEIITQEARKKDMIEKFKILVHDSMASGVKNLPNMSGGQGVWITKALQEAAAKIYSERSGRKYLFSIMDEADAALDSQAIAAFYEMMDKAMDGERKLISVSHSAEAKAVVNNVVAITQFFKGYGE